MAEVFAGHSIGDHGFQKPVAIKRLLPELANDEVFVERLIGEAKLLVGMQHGNIVSVLDLARDGDDVFLVMEFVDGPSLRQLLKARGSRGLPLGVATYIVQASAAGLEFAHARPGGAVIHADISPSNLLLTTSGEVRVADFGIARREGLGQGIVEGKWAYMAPEQARGESLTPRSDVFALGVVLYELICGAHPFGRQVTHEERDSQPMRVIPPRVVKPSIPPGLDAICMRALAHDPRERYARMQQLIDALVEERFSNGFREGASDLANAIREVASGVPALAQPRTMVTDRPVTIATRSLIKELTPARRGSSPSVSASASASASMSAASSSGSIPRVPDSGARTNNILTEDILRAAALLDLPPSLRADGTPMPPFRLPDGSMPSHDLASVVGGHTMTGAQAGAAVLVEQRSARWAFGILGIAAVLGVVAAVAIQLAPSDKVATEPAP
ncbi:MAG TPA: serine/threonine-protein kinase, partial [Kofleriaceae bacterium]